jgi:hypothetical protein
MKKGKLIFDSVSGCWRRLLPEIDGKDLLIASGLLIVIAVVLMIVYWRMV